MLKITKINDIKVILIDVYFNMLMNKKQEKIFAQIC